MRPDSDEDESIFVPAPDQQPVRFNMTFRECGKTTLA